MKILLSILSLIVLISVQVQDNKDNLLLQKLEPNNQNPLHSISVYLENTKTGNIFEKSVGKNLNGKAISIKD